MPKTATCASYRVGAEQHGQRLDAALRALFPQLGVRGRRRLWQHADILVNGVPRAAGFAVRQGDDIQVFVRVSAAETSSAPPEGTGSLPVACARHSAAFAQPHLLPDARMPAGLLCLYKPAGLHSVSLAGDTTPSLQALLPRFVRDTPQGEDVAACLCNRLDYGTSGIVIAASRADAHTLWQETENAGAWHKYYIALLEGNLQGPCTVAAPLETAHRATTRVVACPSFVTVPPLRQTVFSPLAMLNARELCLPDAVNTASLPDIPLTLALCHIHKGARHQIRAHAAHGGYPLWGDTRYGGTALPHTCGEPVQRESFFLHHGVLVAAHKALPPSSLCLSPCPWGDILPVSAQNILQKKIRLLTITPTNIT